ncbi:MAG: hypothetical protein M3R38_00335 [Actinomycetota bacterium]|nr:hypothetical protein [Actinomycetota bacterium]
MDLMNEANFADAAPPTPAPCPRFGCAGTEPSTEAPCEAPATTEVDGLPLCGHHAEEFGAEARADVLEVAASYLSRWLRVAREELCNDELARRLEDAHEEVEVEMLRACEALERPGEEPRRAPLRQTGRGARGAGPRPEGDGPSSTAGTEDAPGPGWPSGVGARRGGRTR